MLFTAEDAEDTGESWFSDGPTVLLERRNNIKRPIFLSSVFLCVPRVLCGENP